MNARKFNNHFGRITAFDLYTSDVYKDFVLVTATCPTASPMVRWAAKILTETVLDFKPSPVRVDIDVFDASSADKKSTFTCLQTIIPGSPKDLMDYMRKLDLSPPKDVKSTLDISNLSVGPCAYRAKNGAKYVKVRMSGYSVPFVLDKNEVSWDRTETKQAILKNNIGGYLLDQIFKALEIKSTYIMERARKKPLNLSMIDEYAKHRLAFYREFKPGYYEPAAKGDLANPKYRPIVLFELGTARNFVMIDDKLYRIKHFMTYTADEKGQTITTVSPPVEPSDGYFLSHDCTELNPEDTFTIDKIHKCLQNKL